MNTITLIEIFDPRPLAEAEAARADAEQALRTIEAVTAAERARITTRLDWLKREIPGLRQKLLRLKEYIRLKERDGLDGSSDKAQLTSTERAMAEMDAELKEATAKLPEFETHAKKLIAEATVALANTKGAENEVRARIGKIISAHEAFNANPAFGLGPIPKFKTLKEAVRHFNPIGFSLADDGAVREAFVGVQVRIHLQKATIEGMVPEPLSWLSGFETFKSTPCPSRRTHILNAKLVPAREFNDVFYSNRRPGLQGNHKVIFYLEETGQILANHPARTVSMPGKPGSEDFSDLFASWEGALALAQEELAKLDPLDPKSEGKLPPMGELIREAWQVAANSVSSKTTFTQGQGRLSESKINDLVGAYWKAFINAPWEPSIEGTYALLKHRCARGEIPNVYSFDIHGHFGFRVRTPDHDWIIGEIYCPPGQFSPVEVQDPAKLTNLGFDEDNWLAELGPVKFCIRTEARRH